MDSILLTQEFIENDFYCKSAVAVSVAGRNCKIKRDNEMQYSIAAEPGQGSFQILISSAATFQKETDVEKDAVRLNGSAAAEGFACYLENHQNWWHTYWAGSYVKFHSEDGDADYVSKTLQLLPVFDGVRIPR